MEIEEKYLSLLWLLIHDKRRKMNGILSSIEIMKILSGFTISYKAYMNNAHDDISIYVEDIEKGNVVFLLPFGTGNTKESMDILSDYYEKKIRNFFGDKFRDDMIVRISEEEVNDMTRVDVIQFLAKQVKIRKEFIDYYVEKNGSSSGIEETHREVFALREAVKFLLQDESYYAFSAFGSETIRDRLVKSLKEQAKEKIDFSCIYSQYAYTEVDRGKVRADGDLLNEAAELLSDVKFQY